MELRRLLGLEGPGRPEVGSSGLPLSTGIWSLGGLVALLAALLAQYGPVLRPRRKALPPGSTGLPLLVGHSVHLLGDVGAWLRGMHESYGPAFRGFFFGTHVIVVDLDVYERALAKLDSSAQFVPLWPTGFQRLLGGNALQFLDAGSGPRGARHRRLKRKVLDAMTPPELRRFLPRMEAIVREEFERMASETAAAGSSALMPHAMRIVKRVILELVLGPEAMRPEEYLKDTSKTLMDGMIAAPVDLGCFTAYGRAMKVRRNYQREVEKQLLEALQQVEAGGTAATQVGVSAKNGTMGDSEVYIKKVNGHCHGAEPQLAAAKNGNDAILGEKAAAAAKNGAAAAAESGAATAAKNGAPATAKDEAQASLANVNGHGPTTSSPATGSQQSRTMLSRLTRDCEHGEGLSIVEMQDTLISLLFGGSLTTAETMQWLLVELSRSERWRRKVQEEQQGLASAAAGAGPPLGGLAAAWGTAPPEGSRSPCPHSLAACYETLRLHCPVDVQLRTVEESVDLGEGCGTVPAGWWVGVHITERGLRLGPDFDPARWEGRAAASEVSAFGLGPHFCVGRQLALWELQVFLHVWLTEYEVTVLNDETYHLTGMKRFRDGLPVAVHRRTAPSSGG